MMRNRAEALVEHTSKCEIPQAMRMSQNHKLPVLYMLSRCIVGDGGGAVTFFQVDESII